MALTPRSYIEDFLVAVGYGIAFGYSRVTALGNNPDIDKVSVPEDIWTGGGLYPWMTAATSLEIVSTNATDAAAGAGARTVVLRGLNDAFQPVTQTLTLNGLAPVAIPAQLYRINSAAIESAGAGRVNAGDINVRDAGGGTVRAIIPAGSGIARQSQYTVPVGYTLSIHSMFVCVGRQPDYAKPVGATVMPYIASPLSHYHLTLEISSAAPYRHDGSPGIIIQEKNDFGLRCVHVSGDDSNVTAAMLGTLRDNTRD